MLEKGLGQPLCITWSRRRGQLERRRVVLATVFTLPRRRDRFKCWSSVQQRNFVLCLVANCGAAIIDGEQGWKRRMPIRQAFTVVEVS